MIDTSYFGKIVSDFVVERVHKHIFLVITKPNIVSNKCPFKLYSSNKGYYWANDMFYKIS